MEQYLGEYYCTLDGKSRILFPASLKKQMKGTMKKQFVINRGFEKCLVLYPLHVWEQIASEINKLNEFIRKNREFMRYYYRGATPLELDGTSRLLLPKPLLEYAEIKKSLVLFAYSNRIEVWEEQLYEKNIHREPEDFAKLAEEVMGKKEV